MTRSPAENQQTVEALAKEWAKQRDALWTSLYKIGDGDWTPQDTRAQRHLEASTNYIGDLAAQASRTQEWKQLATDLGDALRQIEHLVNHEYRLKHHDLAFVFNTVTQVIDVGEVSALLARLHDLAAEQDAA